MSTDSLKWPPRARMESAVLRPSSGAAGLHRHIHHPIRPKGERYINKYVWEGKISKISFNKVCSDEWKGSYMIIED